MQCVAPTCEERRQQGELRLHAGKKKKKKKERQPGQEKGVFERGRPANDQELVGHVSSGSNTDQNQRRLRWGGPEGGAGEMWTAARTRGGCHEQAGTPGHCHFSSLCSLSLPTMV